ncbi:hypothetical protein OG413_45880 [Streptomyces sp. NBC_01433]|uniref:DUF6919 domain-containing protein n=1 Tax=Streptomyces sp. NBC_01433 TaxID=2903864 RepID=UPI0022564C49|nr:hypothetical protein [Streptomyces sp. NBC_01433]MCX4682463.1 hypothetical protein [Streptomyces sp. NBC_01433]MCX4682516.1 hypothetical protein [Streptomyces sp. NBC_01433]
MSRADKRRWRSAENLQELGHLVASWLIGDLASQPGYQPNYGPDEETQHLIPVLVAVNRLGFVTDSSQPGFAGYGYDHHWWEQRAAVSGLVDDPELRDRLVAAAEVAGLTVVQHDMTPRRHAEGVPVTRSLGRARTHFGGFLPVRDLRTVWQPEIIGRRAFDKVAAAWQFTLIDPEWGRDDVLWEALAEVVRQYRLEAVEAKVQEARRVLSPDHLVKRYAFPDRAVGLLKEQLDTELDAAIDEAKLSGCTDADIELVTRGG